MEIINLRTEFGNTSSNAQGVMLYTFLEKVHASNSKVVLVIDAEQTISSSFLNSSIGSFIDNYGYSAFKGMVRLKTTKNQYNRLSKYFVAYKSMQQS